MGVRLCERLPLVDGLLQSNSPPGTRDSLLNCDRQSETCWGSGGKQEQVEKCGS